MKKIKGQLTEHLMFKPNEGENFPEIDGGTVMYCLKQNIPYGSQPDAIIRHDESPKTLYFKAFRDGFRDGKQINLSKVIDFFGLRYVIISPFSKDRKKTVQTYKEGFNDGALIRKETDERSNPTLEILVIEA